MTNKSKTLTLIVFCSVTILILIIGEFKSFNTHSDTTEKSRKINLDKLKGMELSTKKRVLLEKQKPGKNIFIRGKNLSVNRNKKRNGNEDFYRVIIENNIFRPLGWQKPNTEPQYSLIATIIGSEGDAAKAVIMERRSDKFFYVSVGEKVGEAVVKSIKSDEVTLDTAGEQLRIRAEWTPIISSSSRRGVSTMNREKRSNKNSENRSGMPMNADEMRRKFQNSSPDNIKRMLEQMSKTNGNFSFAPGKSDFKKITIGDGKKIEGIDLDKLKLKEGTVVIMK